MNGLGCGGWWLMRRLRADGAFEAIIDKGVFEATQAIYRDRVIHPIGGRARRYSDDEMLKTTAPAAKAPRISQQAPARWQRRHPERQCV